MRHLRLCGVKLNFYPRSPCGERLDKRSKFSRNNGISIHALLAESDSFGLSCVDSVSYISIHALLAESDRLSCFAKIMIVSFLSTLSLRRATVAPVLAVGRAGYFYPRSPCGERRRVDFFFG